MILQALKDIVSAVTGCLKTADLNLDGTKDLQVDVKSGTVTATVAGVSTAINQAAQIALETTIDASLTSIAAEDFATQTTLATLATSAKQSDGLQTTMQNISAANVTAEQTVIFTGTAGVDILKYSNNDCVLPWSLSPKKTYMVFVENANAIDYIMEVYDRKTWASGTHDGLITSFGIPQPVTLIRINGLTETIQIWAFLVNGMFAGGEECVLKFQLKTELGDGVNAPLQVFVTEA